MVKPQATITISNTVPASGTKKIINLNKFTTMKNFMKLSLALFIGAAMFSCQQAEEPAMDGAQPEVTRAYGDKTPKLVVYVETNDTNPLNAGDYTLPNGEPLVDIVEFFASNIHKRTVNGVVEPTLYLNDKMTNLLENGGYLNYVKPLQDKGIKVLLTVLGDHQGIGVGSMNSTQTTQFAQILAHAVAKYGLDGIGFDDEYADDYSSISTSYSEIITKLHALMPADKLITVFDWGYTGSINAAARACIDYGYHGYFGATSYLSSPGIGLDKARWSPISINLGNYNDGSISTIYSNAASAKNSGYGAIMNFNLRRSSNNNPINVFQAIAGGAGYGVPVTCSNGNRAQDWTFVSSGYTITMDEVNAAQ